MKIRAVDLERQIVKNAEMWKKANRGRFLFDHQPFAFGITIV